NTGCTLALELSSLVFRNCHFRKDLEELPGLDGESWKEIRRISGITIRAPEPLPQHGRMNTGDCLDLLCIGQRQRLRHRCHFSQPEKISMVFRVLLYGLALYALFLALMVLYTVGVHMS